MKIDNLINKYRHKAEASTGYYSSTSEHNAYIEIIKDLKEIEKKKYNKQLLLVEDGSIDIENEKQSLEELGYKVILYKQGSQPPKVLGDINYYEEIQ